MSLIKKLSPEEAQKIAAGEIVERPFNIVKELVENALDAAATHITVTIIDGGKAMIRVTDNGSGMDEIDALACFERHATSKITTCNDLDTIQTFGFRGEALASIAAVSRTTLTTKKADAPHAYQVVMEYGIHRGTHGTAAPVGTDIIVEDIFANIPARKKFLKQKETEYRHILHYLQATCLSNNALHLSFYSDSIVVLHAPPVKNFVDRFTQVWGYTDATMIAAAAAVDATVSVEGALVPTQRYRYDRNGIFIFINNRWIKDYKITNAVIKGFGAHLPTGKYPYVVMTLTIPPHLMDVNIHPRKEEVLLQHHRQVELMVEKSVKKALEQHTTRSLGHGARTAMVSEQQRAGDTVQFFSAYHEQRKPAFVPYDFHKEVPLRNDAPGVPAVQCEIKSAEYHRVDTSHYQPEVPVLLADAHTSLQLPTQTMPVDGIVGSQQLPLAEVMLSSEAVIIGQYHKTYILIEQDDGIFLVDQHAAHERILYEKFASLVSEGSPIPLLFPITVTLASAHAVEQLLMHQSLLATYHIMIEQQGPTQIVVTALPPHINSSTPIDAIMDDIVTWTVEHDLVDHDEMMRIIHEKLRAQLACKAAIKAGDVLSTDAMKKLVAELAVTNNRFMCPHGRPTGYLIPLIDIEKRLRRKK